MKEQILDYFGDNEDQFEKNARIVIIRTFYFESEARLYAARLKEASIPCFISNANTVTAFPMGNGGIGLHVKQKDAKNAREIVEQLDQNNNMDVNEDFRDADLEDIEYQKALTGNQKVDWNYILIIIILILLTLLAVF